MALGGALLRQVWQNGQQSSPTSHLGAEHRDEIKIGFGFTKKMG